MINVHTWICDVPQLIKREDAADAMHLRPPCGGLIRNAPFLKQISRNHNSIDPSSCTSITGTTTWIETWIRVSVYESINTVRTEIDWQITFDWLQFGAFPHEPHCELFQTNDSLVGEAANHTLQSHPLRDAISLQGFSPQNLTPANEPWIPLPMMVMVTVAHALRWNTEVQVYSSRPRPDSLIRPKHLQCLESCGSGSPLELHKDTHRQPKLTKQGKAGF